MKRSFLIFFFLLLSYQSNSAVLYPPELEWFTAETEHFYIHYYKGEDSVLNVVADYSERAYRILTEKYNWQPGDKIHLVMSETEDIANGMATVFPYNTVYIYLIPPEVDSVIGFYDNWLYLLIVHELTHIIQLDQARGPAEFLRNIFGRTPFTLFPPFTAFPNALMPQWLIEGIATYEESNETAGGRLNAALMNSMMEYAVRENRAPSIGKGNGEIIEWPWHSFPYFYGGRFYSFLSKNYGEKAITLFHEKYSGLFFPFLLNYTSSKITGYSLSLLWNQWLEDEKKMYGGAQPVISDEAKRITVNGYFNRGVRISPDMRFIAYSKVNPQEYPSVYIFDKEKGREKRVFLRNYGSGMSWSKDSDKIYFTQLDNYNTFYTYSDLYSYSLSSKKINRITKGMRITEFDISPDGKTGTGILIKNGTRTLVVVDLNSGVINELLRGSLEEGYYNPRFSPDGKKIIFTDWSIYGFYDIAYINLLNGEVISLPLPPAFNIFPLWSHDGEAIYFSSDMDGEQSLYYYVLSQNKLYKYKGIRRPVYEFDINENEKKVYFVGYSADGFDIYEADLDISKFQEVAQEDIKGRTALEENVSENVVLKESAYSGLKYLYPRFWMPLVFYGETEGWYFNFITMNQDPLSTHSYSINAEYYGKYKLGGIEIQYQNDLLRPSIGFIYNYTPFINSISEDQEEWWRENSGQLYIKGVFRRFSYYFETGAHYVIKRYSPVGADFTPYYSNGAGVNFLFYSAKSYTLSPGKEDGFIFGTGFRDYAKELGSETVYYKTTIDARSYISIFRNMTISTSFAGGFIWGKTPGEHFSLGGFIYRLDNNIFGLDSTSHYLRGYPLNVISGLNMLAGTIEFRPLLSGLDFGSGTFPLFLQKIHTSVFYDFATAWYKNYRERAFRDSLGFEFKFDLTALYGYNITFTVGFASGLKQDGEAGYYFVFGNSF